MTLQIDEIELDIDDVIEKSNFSSKTKSDLKKSSLVILPTTKFERGNFAAETPNVLKYIKYSQPDLDIGLFENPGQEKILAQHAATIVLPNFFLDTVNFSIQILLSILGSYLYEKLKGIPEPDKQRVITEIFAKTSKNMKVMHIRYEGPVSGLKEITTTINSDKK
jgi:hypothetical protein